MSDLVEITVKVKSKQIKELLHYLDLTSRMKNQEPREITKHRIKLDILRLCSGELFETSSYYKINDIGILDYKKDNGGLDER